MALYKKLNNDSQDKIKEELSIIDIKSNKKQLLKDIYIFNWY